MRSSFYIVFLVVLIGCMPDKLDPDAYISYVSETGNGLVKKQEFGEMAVEVFYQPLEYVYLKERRDKPTSAVDFAAWKKNRENYEYYVVRLINPKVKEIAEYKSRNFNEYAAKLDYLVSTFQEDINLISGNDTMPCKLMHYERNFGLSGNNNFNVVFSKDTTQNDVIMMIDLSLFDLGRVKFKFKRGELNDIPKLII